MIPKLADMGKSSEVDKYWNDEKVDKKNRKEERSNYSYREIIYKILKINYLAENIANYVCIHDTKFESFLAIIL